MREKISVIPEFSQGSRLFCQICLAIKMALYTPDTPHTHVKAHTHTDIHVHILRHTLRHIPRHTLTYRDTHTLYTPTEHAHKHTYTHKHTQTQIQMPTVYADIPVYVYGVWCMYCVW